MEYTRMHYLRMMTVLLGILLAGAVSRPADDPDELLEKVRSVYDAMKDVSCSFRQTILFGVTKNEQQFNGTLLMKKGNRYRVEVEDQVIVTDGKTVWSYSKAANQVLVDKYRDDPRSFTPDKVLVNVPERYAVSMLPPEKKPDGELLVLKLVPRDRMANVKWLKVWIDEKTSLMEKTQVFDVSENLTTYAIEKIRWNISIPESSFTFVPPAGADVVDLR